MSTSAGLSARVAAEVRAEQARQRLTGRELANRVDLPSSTVARWLRNDTDMTLDAAATLAGALGITLVELIERADGPQARDLSHTASRAGLGVSPARRDLPRPVNERYRVRKVRLIRHSVTDDWRIRDLHGSHELPILRLRHGRNQSRCHRVAA